MTIEEIAAAFDMTIKSFAAFIGYSRQTLYNGKIKNVDRAFAALERLGTFSEVAYKNEVYRAMAKLEKREAAIKAFEERFIRGEQHER